ncbi:RNA polymerase III C11 subunit [Lecanora helva]
MLLFCPMCSNTLTVTRCPLHPTNPTGQNRLDCKSCSYHFLLDKAYYERKEMKRKEVEDVMGGKGAWDGVDRADGEFACVCGLDLGHGGGGVGWVLVGSKGRGWGREELGVENDG